MNFTLTPALSLKREGAGNTLGEEIILLLAPRGRIG